VSGPIIRFEKVNKWYGRHLHVLRDIDLEVVRGERIVICGPSGSGKSTLIRCINALEAFSHDRFAGCLAGRNRAGELGRGQSVKAAHAVGARHGLRGAAHGCRPQ
jgi:ABC-type phosphate/phosphonate transport system ATPase subunit